MSEGIVPFWLMYNQGVHVRIEPFLKWDNNNESDGHAPRKISKAVVILLFDVWLVRVTLVTCAEDGRLQV